MEWRRRTVGMGGKGTGRRVRRRVGMGGMGGGGERTKSGDGKEEDKEDHDAEEDPAWRRHWVSLLEEVYGDTKVEVEEAKKGV